MEILAVLSVAGFLWFVAKTPKENMNMAWLLMILAILLSPILAYLLPAFR